MGGAVDGMYGSPPPETKASKWAREAAVLRDIVDRVARVQKRFREHGSDGVWHNLDHTLDDLDLAIRTLDAPEGYE